MADSPKIAQQDAQIQGRAIVPGSIVSLVSGGPNMTVRGRYADGDNVVVQCVWFVWAGADNGWTGPHKDWFAENDLVPA